MQPLITKVDGIFGESDLSNIQWEDYASQTLSTYKLLTINGDGIGNGYAISRPMSSEYYYNATADEWYADLNGNVKISNTSGWNVVFMRDPKGESGGSVYVCQDEHIMKIPNIAQYATFRVRIESGITPENQNTYKHVSPGTDSISYIPIAPIGYTNSSTPSFEYVVVGQDRSGTGITIRIISFTTGTAKSGSIVPKSQQYLMNATDKPIQDLETRVSILEDEVATLKATVAKHDKTLSELPALVAAVSSNVSKLYVAR